MLTLAVLLSSGTSFAAPPKEVKEAKEPTTKAEQLFDEGTRLLDEKKFAEALPLLLESQRLGPGIGVTMYVADCYEGLGHSAKALSLFREAEEMARAKKDARESIARQRADEVATRVPMVLVQPAAPVDADLDVRIDDERIDPARWKDPIPLDPGPHTIRAESGPHNWSLAVDLPAQAATTAVLIPHFRPAPPPVNAPPRTMHAAGVVQFLGGALLVGAGLGFGLAAISKQSASEDNGHCSSDNRCDAEGLALRSDGLSAARVSTVLVTVGLLAIASGVTFYAIDARSAGRAAPGAARAVAAAFHGLQW
jgi:hypothetical protein